MVLLLRVTQRLRGVCLVDLLRNLHDFKTKILFFPPPPVLSKPILTLTIMISLLSNKLGKCQECKVDNQSAPKIIFLERLIQLQFVFSVLSKSLIFGLRSSCNLLRSKMKSNARFFQLSFCLFG